jgi:D-3-phosphoglycerate dehydrogenase
MSEIVMAVAEGIDTTWALPVAEKLGFSIKVGPLETLEQFIDTTTGCQAVLVALHRLDAEKFEKMPKSVKCVSRLGVGLDSIDLVAAKAHHMPVIFQPTYAYNEVANHAISMIMALHRGLFQANNSTQAGQWIPAPKTAEIISLQDSSLGVIGCGRIGKNFIEKMRPFVKEIIGYDPGVTSPIAGVRMVSNLDDLLTQCKVISMHAPYMPSTHHMISEKELAKMQKGSILVNVSRGGLIDEDALVKALESGHLDGAGLDVYEKEPLAEDSILRHTKNLIVTPHIAWYSQSAGPRLFQWGFEDAYNLITSGKINNGNFAVGPF